MTQNIKRTASHLLVTGMSGMGKTSYVERYLAGSYHDFVFIFDHQTEFFERLNLIPCYDFSDMEKSMQDNRIICFDYTLKYYGRLEAIFEAFCDYVFELSRNVLLPANYESLMVCDEIQKVIGPNTLPQSYKNVIQTGRRFNIDTAQLSQQPNELHNSLRNQVTEFVTYKLQDDRALKWVSEMGIDIEMVRGLPNLSYHWKNMHTGEERDGKIDYPLKGS